jgi:hypothetical protein
MQELPGTKAHVAQLYGLLDQKYVPVGAGSVGVASLPEWPTINRYGTTIVMGSAFEAGGVRLPFSVALTASTARLSLLSDSLVFQTPYAMPKRLWSFLMYITTDASPSKGFAVASTPYQLQYSPGKNASTAMYDPPSKEIRIDFNKPYPKVGKNGVWADLRGLVITPTTCRLDVHRAILGFDLVPDPVFHWSA